MKLIGIVLIGSLIVILCKIVIETYHELKNIKERTQYENQQTPTVEYHIPIIENQPTINTPHEEYSNRYQKKYLLTKNEWYEYRKLKQFAEQRGLQVCPKVRLLDLIEPRRGDPKYKTLFYKIQAKHVDFVICDQNLYVKAIIELDDNSHNQNDRQERDDFVDTILKDVGYLMIRTRSITEHTLSTIDGQNQPKTASAGQDPSRHESGTA